jgi:hypothetical protein
MAKGEQKAPDPANKREWQEVMDKVTPEFIAEMNDSPMIKVMHELERCKDEPRLLIIITNGFVELIINLLVERSCKHGGKIVERRRDFPHSIKLTLLNELGILSDHHYKLLDWFRDIRNEAAHKWEFKLNPDKMKVFADPKYSDPKNFGALCIDLLSDLFSTFPIVRGVVLPAFFDEENTPTLMVSVPAPNYKIPLTTDPKTVDMPFDDLEDYKKKNKID